MSKNTNIFSPYGRIGNDIPYYSDLAKEADHNGFASTKVEIRGSEVDVIAKIVMMSPEEYMEESKEFYLFFDYSERDAEKELENRYYELSTDEVFNFFEENEGNLFLPYLDYTNGDQDGLHRAIYANMLANVTQIPVLIVSSVPAYENMVTTDYLEQLEKRGIIMESKRLTEDTLLRDYYMSEFPEDELGQEINPDATFMGLFETLDSYEDVYEYIGNIDSLVRERLFAALAELMDVNYEYVYDQWLMAASMRNESKEAQLLESKANETYEYFLKAGSQALSQIPADERDMVRAAIKSGIMANTYDTDELEPALDIINRTKNSDELDYKDIMIKRLELIVVANIIQHVVLLMKTQEMTTEEALEAIVSNEKHTRSIADISTEHYLDMVKKLHDAGWATSLSESAKALDEELSSFTEKDADDPCWDGYEQYGMKMKDGEEVPNCVPIEEAERLKNEETVEESFERGKRMNYSLKELILGMLDIYEFELHENSDGTYSVVDLQGANLNNIEDVTFVTVSELLDRLDAYHNDYILRIVEELADDFGLEKEYDSLTKLFNNEKEFTQFFKSENPFTYELALFIENPPRTRLKEVLGTVEEAADIEPEFMDKLHELFGDLVDLRNRISPDGDDVIYEEDHLLLDEVLDAMESLMGHEMTEEMYEGKTKKH